MPKLKPDTQHARRQHILDAAEICFARSGFHRCTMHEICKEAGISPGALYVYFPSKEDLIAGIASRDRAKFAGHMAEVAKAPDLLGAFRRLAEHYILEEPLYKRRLCLEIGLEAMRNEVVGEIYRSVDNFVIESLERLLARAEAEGKIAPRRGIRKTAEILTLIGDGLQWRAAIDPDFAAKDLISEMTAVIGALIEPLPSTGAGEAAESSNTVNETTP